MNIKETLFWILMAGCLISFLITFPGCKTVENISDVKIDTIYISKNYSDTVKLYDSIYIKEKGDTIYIDKTHFRDVYRIKTDTIYKYTIDTIKVPVIKEKVVKVNEIKLWQKILMYIGVFFIIFFGIWLYKKIN